jgi:hypothetical protein
MPQKVNRRADHNRIARHLFELRMQALEIYFSASKSSEKTVSTENRRGRTIP